MRFVRFGRDRCSLNSVCAALDLTMGQLHELMNENKYLHSQAVHPSPVSIFEVIQVLDKVEKASFVYFVVCMRLIDN